MKSHSGHARRARPALGTLVEVRVRAAAGSADLFERAFEAVDRVHRLMSRHERESDVARINRAAPGAKVEVDAWTWQVLDRAKELHAATGGLFDCAAATCGGGSLSDLRLVAGNGVFVGRRLALTLDGIAKGYAVDRAVDALRTAGAEAGAVNAGGDLRLFGDELQTIHVRHPASPGRLICVGAAREAAVATSGRYFSNSTLVDPRTGRAAITDWSATVVAADCATADALTKPCLLHPAGAKRLAAAFAAEAILFSPQHPRR